MAGVTSGGFEPFPRAAIGQSVAQRFEQVARRYPDRLALETGSHRLSYSELNRAANRICHAVLQRRGERAEPIAVLMDKTAPAVTSAIALAKAGKIYVPLDPSFPQRRLASLLADFRPPLLLTSTRHEALARAVCEPSCEVLNIEVLDGDGGAEDPGLALAPEALAYILYTSGSTGQPKAVCHSHLGLLHQIMRHTNFLRISAEDRVTMLGSASAAQANTQLFVALLNGAALFPKDLKQDGLADLVAWINRNQITCYRSSTSVFRHWAMHLAGHACPTLRLISIGGEPVYRQDIDLYRAHFRHDCQLVNALSSTETGTICMGILDPTAPIDGQAVPVGHALEDTEVFLVDKAGERVGKGDVGEIVVRSRGLAAGYWTRNGVIRGAFVPDPDDDSLRSFRTGDMGQLMANGALLHLGRADSIVKIRGHRIDVREVETMLRTSDMVMNVAVVDREDHSGERCLVAYIVRNGSSPPSPGALRQFLKDRLPEHMVPSSIELIAELPLTASGKIDRQALPPPARVASVPESTSPSFGTLGTQICVIWENLLGVTGIGPHDDFMDLGGNSLMGIEMLLRIEKVCGRTLAPSRLLGGTITIDRLVHSLIEDEQANFSRPLAAVHAGGSRPPLFFLHGDHENGGLYCHDLARCLGADQPLYAVTPHGLDGDPLPWSIEAMARERLSAVRAVQPTGPYRLGGFCTGGIIAFEMTRQLEAQGEEVGTLLLVDASLVNSSLPSRLLGLATRQLLRVLMRNEAARQGVHQRLQEALANYAESARSRKWGRVRYLADKLRSLPGRLSAVAPGINNPPEIGTGTGGFLTRHRAYGARRRVYVPGRINGRIALFRSEYLRNKPPGGPTAGWCHVASKVDVHHIPGSHQSAVTRYVAALADKMKPYLN